MSLQAARLMKHLRQQSLLKLLLSFLQVLLEARAGVLKGMQTEPGKKAKKKKKSGAKEEGGFKWVQKNVMHTITYMYATWRNRSCFQEGISQFLAILYARLRLVCHRVPSKNRLFCSELEDGHSASKEKAHCTVI